MSFCRWAEERDKIMDSKLIFFEMGRWAGWFSLTHGCLKVVSSGWWLIFGPCRRVALPWCRAIMRRGGVRLGRVENDLSARAQPIGTDEDADIQAPVPHSTEGWWDLLRARLLRLGLRRLCQHTTFRIPRQERRGFWPSCCSGRCRRVGCRRAQDRPCGWW